MALLSPLLQLREDMSDLVKDKSKLKEELANVKDSAHSVRQENNKLQKQLGTERKALQLEIEKTSQQSISLVEKLQREKEGIQDMLELSQSALNASEEALLQVKDEAKSLRDDVSQLQELLREAERKETDSNYVKEMTVEEECIKLKLDRTTASCTSYKQELDDLKNTNAGLNAEICSLRLQLEDAAKKEISMTTLVERIRAEKDAAFVELDASRQAHVLTKAELLKVEKMSTSLQTELTCVAKQLKVVQTGGESVAELRKEVKLEKDCVSRLKSELDRSREHVSHLQSELNTNNASRVLYEQTLAQLFNKEAELKCQLSVLQEELRKEKEQVEALSFKMNSASKPPSPVSGRQVAPEGWSTSERQITTDKQISTEGMVVGGKQISAEGVVVGEKQISTEGMVVGEKQISTEEVVVGEKQISTERMVVGDKQISTEGMVVGEKQVSTEGEFSAGDEEDMPTKKRRCDGCSLGDSSVSSLCHDTTDNREEWFSSSSILSDMEGLQQSLPVDRRMTYFANVPFVTVNNVLPSRATLDPRVLVSLMDPLTTRSQEDPLPSRSQVDPLPTKGTAAGKDSNVTKDPNRVRELKRRNAAVLPHLRSSYPVETQVQPETPTKTETMIRSGRTDHPPNPHTGRPAQQQHKQQPKAFDGQQENSDSRMSLAFDVTVAKEKSVLPPHLKKRMEVLEAQKEARMKKVMERHQGKKKGKRKPLTCKLK